MPRVGFELAHPLFLPQHEVTEIHSESSLLVYIMHCLLVVTPLRDGLVNGHTILESICKLLHNSAIDLLTVHHFPTNLLMVTPFCDGFVNDYPILRWIC
jgi:hypothetical protein